MYNILPNFDNYTLKLKDWVIAQNQRDGRRLPTILARGLTPCFLAAASVMSTRAAAPSLRVLALAAVMVPPSVSGLNAGLRLGNFVKSALERVKEGGESEHN